MKFQLLSVKLLLSDSEKVIVLIAVDGDLELLEWLGHLEVWSH